MRKNLLEALKIKFFFILFMSFYNFFFFKFCIQINRLVLNNFCSKTITFTSILFRLYSIRLIQGMYLRHCPVLLSVLSVPEIIILEGRRRAF